MGAAWGLVNGWLAAYQGIPPFIVTLATMSVIRGIALYRTEGFSVPVPADTYFAKLGTAEFLGFSASAWIALVVVVIGAIALNRMRFGRYVTGIGSNVESVRRSGVNTRRVLMMTLVFTGLAAGIAGLLIAARLGSGSANSATGFELTVITAVVLGGTNLFGGSRHRDRYRHRRCPDRNHRQRIDPARREPVPDADHHRCRSATGYLDQHARTYTERAVATPAIRTLGARTLMSKVRTVTGTVDSSELGLVLPHEHLHNDVTGAYTEAPDPVVAQRLAGPVRAEDAWLLHDNPYYSLDNCRVDDASAVVEDLADFARLGGRTIVDLTPPGLGRAPEKLAEFSRKSDVRVIMGSGWYLETTHPVEVHELGVDDLAGSLVEEFDPAKELAPGVIGEIGVSPLFTQNEAKALRAACIAQREGGRTPVRPPSGLAARRTSRRRHRGRRDGVDPQAVSCATWTRRGHDADYQRSLADRGVFLEFDMIGMPFDFPGEGLSPHPAETGTAVAGLVTSGYASQLLLSHDLFLKSMLRKHGGNGFSYVPLAFAARLVRAGVDPQQVSALMRDNPRSLFEQAAKGNRSSHG